ncbi:hypothetical protein BVC80_9063g81 [Macleaya cordata]|uniref:Thionin-like protein n=1 Tax=Macleaya cordata TaxID=56857 RepID=A0A200PNE0_MACCD|nr:hypothetical protein BVC80_9063g81 [Macleaya cordata]
MESKRSVKPIAMMLIITVLVLGMFVKQTTATDFSLCYVECMRGCSRSIEFHDCPDECTRECQDAAATANDLHYYCRVGCASSSCTHISTPHDPRANEVEGCVNSCSNKCTKQY